MNQEEKGTIKNNQYKNQSKPKITKAKYDTHLYKYNWFKSILKIMHAYFGWATNYISVSHFKINIVF